MTRSVRGLPGSRVCGLGWRYPCRAGGCSASAATTRTARAGRRSCSGCPIGGADCACRAIGCRGPLGLCGSQSAGGTAPVRGHMAASTHSAGAGQAGPWQPATTRTHLEEVPPDERVSDAHIEIFQSAACCMGAGLVLPGGGCGGVCRRLPWSGRAGGGKPARRRRAGYSDRAVSEPCRPGAGAGAAGDHGGSCTDGAAGPGASRDHGGDDAARGGFAVCCGRCRWQCGAGRFWCAIRAGMPWYRSIRGRGRCAWWSCTG